MVALLLSRGVRRFCLTGGEPLLYKSLPDLLRQIRSASAFSVLSVADGDLFIRRFQEVREDLQFVRFSVHGPARIHDVFLGRSGALESIIRAVDLIRGVSSFSFSFVATEDNVRYLSETAALAKSVGASKISVYSVLSSGYGQRFLDEGRGCRPSALETKVAQARTAFEDERFRIPFYSYSSPGECVLVYPSGDVYLDPWPDGPNSQLCIGNLHDPELLWSSYLSLSQQLSYPDHIQR